MCIIISKSINGSKVLAKNRDRAYKPTIEVVHTIIDGVEVAYLRDTITDWSEGMNEFGIGLVNTALMVGYDENEKKIVKKGGKPSKDGNKIRKALSQKTIKDVLNSAISFDGGIRGHTFIGTPTKTIAIESTSKHNPKYELHHDELIVRTNHGHLHHDAGYTKGADYLSSKIRKISAEKSMNKAKEVSHVLPFMRKKYYEWDSNLNMARDTNKMFTSSQLLLDLTNKVFKLSYREHAVDTFVGVRCKFPDGYEPKITILISKLSKK
jgi:hypothetical protein